MLFRSLRSVKVHGKGEDKYDNVRIGWNSRLDTIQAAILSVKLKAFIEYELENVNKAAEKYTALLSGLVETPVVLEGYYSSWAQYTIKTESREQRDSLQNWLKDRDIPTMVYYSKEMHKQLAFKDVKSYVECPVTSQLCDTVLALPMHPYMTDQEIQKVTEGLRDFFNK